MGEEMPIRAVPPSLKAAIRRARVEDAERPDVVAELRGAEIARLEMLQSALEPVLAQAPEDVELFDVGLAHGDRPRLFIDMIAFVEMGRDRRLYRFIQNTRHGSVVLAESEQLDRMTEAITAYIARRLIEREKALASDAMFRAPPQAAPAPLPPRERGVSAPETEAAPRPAERRERGLVLRTAAALAELILSLAMILAVAAVIWFAWRFALGWRPPWL